MQIHGCKGQKRKQGQGGRKIEDDTHDFVSVAPSRGFPASNRVFEKRVHGNLDGEAAFGSEGRMRFPGPKIEGYNSCRL